MIFGWTELRAPDTSEDQFIKVDCVVSFASNKSRLATKVFFFDDDKKLNAESKLLGS
jgi:hypothetical protein